MAKLIILMFLVVDTLASGGLQDKLDEKRNSSKAPEEIKSVMAKALKDLKDSGIEDKGLKSGALVPSFELEGQNISSYYTKAPVVIKFFRGSWCPYCMIELKEYKELINRFKQTGCELIVLSPDTKLENKKTKDKLNLPFELHSDKDNHIAKKFGIAFGLSQELQGIYTKFGINLQNNQGNSNNELPLPGTYVVNQRGKITYTFIDADYTKRADPLDVIEACQKLK